MKLLISAFMFALLGVQAAGAAPLEGKVLACANDSFLGHVTTNYVFLNDGSGDVLARSSYFGSEVTNYKLEGTKLLIREVGTDKYIAYTTNGNIISANYTVCISPGQGGGDAHPICQLVHDTCTLN